MTASPSPSSPVLAWYRYGAWPAHLFVDGKQACKTPHGRFSGATPDAVRPHLVEGEGLTPHGQPYGRTCAFCLKVWQRHRGATVIGHGNRIYPPAKVGDVYGDRKIVEIIGSDPKRFDERVRWACACGKEGETFLYNLRQYAREQARCTHREVRVGVSYGAKTIVELLESQRARWRCICGVEGESPLHDIRRGRRDCRHSRIAVLDVCECGGHIDAHGPGGGACFDDDCDCDTRPEGACKAFRGAR